MLHSQTPRKEGPSPYYAKSHREVPGLVKRHREWREMGARAFTVVSIGRSRQGRVNRHYIGWLE